MNQASSSGNVQLHVEGDVSGQIAIGNNILQIGEIYGGIVNIIAPDKKPCFSHRAGPVYLRPRAFPGLLDRAEELGAAIGALRVSESVSIHGQNGLGKTTLLRHLAYNSPRDNCPDGIVYLSARGQNVDDLLQTIFETFYESDRPAKPTTVQLHQLLQGVSALILLDDLALAYDQVSELINSAPQCVFIFASPERCLWGEGCCIQLDGLPVSEALILIERELGRPLEVSERSIAQEFCQRVKGSPLYLIQAAALVRQGKKFTEIGDRFRESEDAFLEFLLTELTDSQRCILALLAASGNFPLSINQLKAISQVQDFDIQLKALMDLRLIQANSPTYNLTGSLALSLERITDLSDWENRILEYFVQWIKQNPPLPDVTDALNLLLSLLEKANRDGRWDDVITLGRGIEKALILGKRWQAWLQVVEWVLKAAQALGDRAVQGWGLHQIGTRSLCLGDLEPARQSLTQALRIREALGDKAGAAVTRHNLGLIIAPPAPPREAPRSKPKQAPGKGMSPMLKAMFILMGVAIIAIVLLLIRIFVIQPLSGVPPIAQRTATKVSIPPVAHATKTPTRKPPTPTRILTRTRTPPPTIPPCNPGVWYCENFEDKVAQDWELRPDWSIQKDGSNYVLAGNRHEFATLQDHSWSDYRVKFRLRLWEGTIHLNYRIMPAPDGFTRYYVGFHQNYLYLQKSERGGGWRELTSSQFQHSLGDWHTVEIAGWGGHLAVYVDGRLELQYIDEDYLRNGSIAFETLENSSAQIDDIEVTDPGPEPAIESYEPPADNLPATEVPVEIISPEPLPVECTSYYMTWEQSTDRPGMDYWNGFVGDPDTPPSQKPVICQDMCLNDTYCQAFTYDTYTNVCWLKNGQPEAVYKYENISGIKVCQ
jgi:hypothetical protein